jgi:hypothetical protein
MLETYWQRAARQGNLPPGMSVLENRMGQAGRYDTPNTVPVGAGAYGLPGARPGALSPRAAALASVAQGIKDANASNLYKANLGNRMLGLPERGGPGMPAPAPEWQKLGFAGESAYLDDQRVRQEAAAGAQPAGSMTNASGGVGAGLGAGVGATGGNITPQALASRAQAKARGFYNSSSALNREAVTNAQAMGGLAAAAFNQALQRQQIEESNRRARAAEASDLRNAQLAWIERQSDPAPSMDAALALAREEGLGNTEGMSYPAAGGGGGGGGGVPIGGTGYGGAAGTGYGVPENFGFSTPGNVYRRKPVHVSDDAWHQNLLNVALARKLDREFRPRYAEMAQEAALERVRRRPYAPVTMAGGGLYSALRRS